MRLLLDTHALIWWLTGDRRLKASERGAIADSESIVHVSAASIWEIAFKESLGRINVQADLEREAEEDGFLELPIRWRHARAAGALPRHHEDPFDRMLVAQARIENLVSSATIQPSETYDVTLLPESKHPRPR